MDWCDVLLSMFCSSIRDFQMPCTIRTLVITIPRTMKVEGPPNIVSKKTKLWLGQTGQKNENWLALIN